MSKMLTELGRLKLFKEEILQKIKSSEYECNTAETFIEYLIKEGSKSEILQCCKLLREQGRQCENLADLIEGKNTDGADTGKSFSVL
jgi:hypothetical protein